MPGFNPFSPKSVSPVVQPTEDASVTPVDASNGSQPSETTTQSSPDDTPASITSTTPAHPSETPASPTLATDAPTTKPTRKFSLKAFSILARSRSYSKPALSQDEEHEKMHAAASSFEHRRMANIPKTRADKRAYNDALAVRSLIVGTSSPARVNKAVAKPQISQMKSLKSQLMKPSSANRVISQLRSLPVADPPEDTRHPGHIAPIHAVCLTVTEREADSLHFGQLTDEQLVRSGDKDGKPAKPPVASVDALVNAFNDMSIVDLVQSPDFGLGQPGDSPGILAGAVPTAETVINGFKQITPQLMALGFATGQAIVPNHTGIYPPTDRISVLTYWWGLELCLPPPTLEYLSTAKSISNAAVNFLTALSMINQGVREIIPFVRYISQYLEFEFGIIEKQNQGRGVVCAATWIMPAAMIPRPWDFPIPPDEALREKLAERQSRLQDPRNPTSALPLPALSPALAPAPGLTTAVGA